MSTRGSVGFRLDGKDYLQYNHSDSYPSGLGVEVEKFLKNYLNWEGEYERNLNDLKRDVRKLKVVDDNIPPTPEDIRALAPYTDLRVSGQSTSDWYCLTRHAQDDLNAMLKSGYIRLDNEFIKDSLFCEWAYVINLDEENLEIYQGFQKKYHKAGRYARKRPRNWVPEYAGQTFYYPCALKQVYSLSTIADETMPAIDWESVEREEEEVVA